MFTCAVYNDVRRTLKVLGEQAGDSCMMFSTSFSYEVLASFEQFFSLLKKKKGADEKFDYLLSYGFFFLVFREKPRDCC